jgi:CheY-like chemotaxis protein
MSGYPGGEEAVDLRKPFTPEELLQAVRRALDGSQ